MAYLLKMFFLVMFLSVNSCDYKKTDFSQEVVVHANRLKSSPLDEKENNLQNELMITPSKVDFGKVNEGSVVQGSTSLMNVSNIPIDIIDIQSGCGCSKAVFKKVTLKPRETHTISIVVDTHNRSKSLISQYVILYRTNESNMVRNVSFSSVVSVIAEGKITSSPPTVSIRDVLPKSRVEKSIILTESSGKVGVFPQIKNIQSPEWLQSRLIEDNAIQKKVIISGIVPNVNGDFQDHIRIHTDNPKYPLLEIPLSWHVNGYFSVQPESACEIVSSQEFTCVTNFVVKFTKAGKLLEEWIKVEDLKTTAYRIS
ncbi:MAG: DUF1573 domain-containing protein [Planctomycetaceae bacterium]|jgi:hypothetical protein|nr:DUF1573 domain-containing protein [Planctomycetaceae bacterium]